MKMPVLKLRTGRVSYWATNLALIIIASGVLPATSYAIESAAGDSAMQLRAEQWEAAREGERILALPVLQQLVNRWDAHPGQKIELRYPGGEEGELWVGALRDWLVSLGVASSAMVAVPGSGQADIIEFQIIQAGD